MMGVRRPKTITGIGWFGIISFIWGIYGLIFQYDYTIVLGYLLKGNLFRVYYGITCICILIASVGLLKMRYWGYIGTITINILIIIISLTNYVFISENALLETGWKGGAGAINDYKNLLAFGSVLLAGINLLLFKYRHMFNLTNNRAG